MIENKTYKVFYSAVLLTLISIILYTVYFIFSNLNKGFELSDESYYAVATIKPYEYKTFASCFGLINNKLCFGAHGLYQLRLFKFFYQTIGLILFCISLYHFFKNKFPQHIKISLVTILLIFISGYSNYDYLPQTLSYNSWSLILALFFWTCFLFILTSKNKKTEIGLNLIIGFILTCLFYSKLPNALVLLGFLAAYYLFFKRSGVLLSAASVLIGLVLALLFLWSNYVTFKTISGEMFNDMLNVNHAGIGLYIEQIKDFALNFNLYLVLLEVLIGVGLFFIKGKLKYLLLLIPIVINSTASLNCFGGNGFQVNNDFTFVFLLLINFVFLFIVFKNELKINKEMLLIFLMLLASPLLLAVGTNNSLFYTSSQLMVFFIAAAVIISLSCFNAYTFAWVNLTAVFMAVFILSILSQGMFLKPYRQTSLNDKNLPMFFSNEMKGIYESKERFILFYKLNEMVKRNNPNQYPISASFPYLGASYLSENTNMPMFWLPDPSYGLSKVKDFFKIPKFKDEKMFILLSSKDAANAEYIKVLRDNHIDIGNALKLCDSLYIDYNKEFIYFYKTM